MMPHVNYAEELNEDQLAVVTQGEGPCLVLSGPGTGKTRTLVHRVAYLAEQGVPPQEILLLTFTKKAAHEMMNRAERLLKTAPEGMWGGTFHHIGNTVLRKYGSFLGYNSGFLILDREDSRDLISSIQKELFSNQKSFPKPGVMQEMLGLAANSSQSFERTLDSFPQWSGVADELSYWAKTYEERKRTLNLMDYDDLLVKWLELLDQHEEIRTRLSQRFRYILVDEYQDVNPVQNKIVNHLAQNYRNVLAVGDDAQSIFSFRGADIRTILDFQKTYPDAKIFRLETNYRSTPEILEIANAVLERNTFKLEKTLKGTKGPGAAPMLSSQENPMEEAAFVARSILQTKGKGVPFSEVAVLFRNRYQAADLELELARRGVPYLVRGGVRFFEQAHVKDVLAFLKILANPREGVSWERLLRRQEGVGTVSARRIAFFLSLQGEEREQAIKLAPKKAAESLLQFFSLLEELQAFSSDVSAVIERILSGWYAGYLEQNYPDAKNRKEDIRQLALLSHDYASIEEMLSAFSLSEEFQGEAQQEDKEKVTLSTIHQAKGLEWNTVFLISLKEGEFPYEKGAQSLESLEEERRLFYVAITRCKEHLYLTYPQASRRWAGSFSSPSRFLLELEHLLDFPVDSRELEQDWI